jgi:peptidyl-prolyl cis-trans isomerase C
MRRITLGAESMLRYTFASSQPRLVLLALACVAVLSACDEKKDEQASGTAASDKATKPELQYGLTPEQSAQTLVTVGPTKITLGEFAERLGGQSPYLRARYNSPERRREFLDNMVRFELLAKEAQKRGYEQADDVERVRKQMMVQQMMQDLFEKNGVQLSDVTDAEIKQYYDTHKGEFDKPAQMRASHIHVKDKSVAERLLAEAKEKPEDMQAFRKLAQENNTDPATKDSYGDLRFFSAVADPEGEEGEPERPEAVRKAAFTLKNIGDVFPEAVQTNAGFHIVKLTGKREPMTRSLEDARRLIQNRLWRQKREQAIEKFVADLRAKANVQESADVLSKVQVKPNHDADEQSDEHAAGKSHGKH